MAPPAGSRPAATSLIVAALLFSGGAPAVAANPSMSEDFGSMMHWLSHEMAQGLAFNAGSSFDPPREVTDRRLQPDISIGGGKMPLDKTKFPEPKTPALRDLGAAKIFPSSVLFPNLAMHLRAGLPGRCDFAVRFADMTTPPGYKISPTATGKGQSNSFGFTLRKHVLGGDNPLVTLGAHFNHVYGRFEFKTKFNIDNIQGFSADSDVNGGIYWSVNSFGLNAIASQNYGMWTPFFGVGYNYVTGSVRASLDAYSNTPLISPIRGSASEHPEQNNGRVIFGTQLNRSWVNFFTNGEIKMIGVSKGKSWIVHAGMSLPFHVGRASAKSRYAGQAVPGEQDVVSEGAARPGRRGRPAAARKEMFGGPVNEKTEGPAMIFIQ